GPLTPASPRNGPMVRPAGWERRMRATRSPAEPRTPRRRLPGAARAHEDGGASHYGRGARHYGRGARHCDRGAVTMTAAPVTMTAAPVTMTAAPVTMTAAQSL